jgi:RNA polymerase sigma factor (sigma-70 family)
VLNGSIGAPTGNKDQVDRQERFTEFYRCEYPGSVRLAYTLVGSLESAEDVVQELFARLGERFLDLDNPAAYLRVGVVHECQRVWQHRRRITESGLPVREHADPSGSAELFDVLLKLPYRQRAVLVLRYWADWSEADIAEALDCRPGAVKSLASRGLARLRQEISQ